MFNPAMAQSQVEPTSFREQLARAIVRRRAKKFWAQGAPAFKSEDALFEDMWAKDVGLFRGTAFADVDVVLDMLTKPSDAVISSGADQSDAYGNFIGAHSALEAFVTMIRTIKDGK